MMLQQRYVDLLKKSLLDWYGAGKESYHPLNDAALDAHQLTQFPLPPRIRLCKERLITLDDKLNGTLNGMHADADTMIGLKRLNNIEYCVGEISKHNVPGDFIETGVWRGGATIFMKGLLTALNDTTRVVWVADSFEGLPTPDSTLPDEIRMDIDPHRLLPVSEEDVRKNFEKYDLLDERVRFLKGWFKDTLPTAPIDTLALLRLDGDLYESTYTALECLYPKLSVGGYVIVDDFGGLACCRKAVADYRKRHGITERISQVDWTGVYWKKEKAVN